MASITSWTRLEPRARSKDISLGLQARIHDPLWLLARQWQFGEFAGEDAASPVQVRLRAEHAPLNRYAPGPAAALGEYDASVPLETMVEREPGPDPARNPLHAAETGTHFLRMLAAAGLGGLRGAVVAQYRLSPPAEEGDAGRTLALLAARAPDGHALEEALREAARTSTLPPEVALVPGEEARFREVAAAWLRWVDELYSRSTGPSPWQEDRMEYGFRAGAEGPSGRVVLAAPEYHGGRLDWYDFVESTGERDGFPSNATVIVRNVLPGRCTFPGMPVDRWWEFEDARTDFGGVEAEPGDLARLLVAEYATVYSNDWYLVPLELPVGSLCRVRSLVVRDTFGQETLVGEADPAGGFSLFRTSGTQRDARSDFLFLAPALPAEMESEPVEEVRFLRDEMANLAWAVERTVEGRTGLPVDRHQAWAARRGTTPAEPDTGGILSYRLASEVPEHWFALVPVDVEGAMKLRLLYQPRRNEEGELEQVTPAGQVLRLAEPRLVQEEEVPREGIRVRRAWQHARGADGATHVWLGRRKTPSGGEGSSGLVFDQVRPPAGGG